MGAIDIIILLLFIPFIFLGLKKGIVDQLVTIASLLMGTWLAFHFATTLSAALGNWVKTSHATLNIICFIFIFIAAVTVIHIGGGIARKFFKFIMMGWLDKLLGFVFAIANCALITGLLIMAFTAVNDNLGLISQETLDNSVLFNPIKDFAYIVFPYLKGLFMNA